jgi:hypothetical protein
MKVSTLLPFAALACCLSVPLFAAEPIVTTGGLYTYTQNFNTMFMPTVAGSVTTGVWNDNSTVPNWYFHYSTNVAATPAGVFAGANFTYSGNDGSVAPVLSLLSGGVANSPERSFCIPSTTARCEQSGIVVFQNNATRTVELKRIRYNGEVIRTNSTASTPETIIPYYRVTDTQALALTITSQNLLATTPLTPAAAFPLDGTPTPGNFLTACIQMPMPARQSMIPSQ